MDQKARASKTSPSVSELLCELSTLKSQTLSFLWPREGCPALG